MNEYKILEKLKSKMLKQNHSGYNVGAVVLDKKGCILSYGFNSYIKTHTRMLYNPMYNSHQIFVHAECDAIYKLNYKVNPYTIIVCRLNKQGEYMNAKPCIGCYLEIKNTTIKNIYYTNGDDLVLFNSRLSIEDYD